MAEPKSVRCRGCDGDLLAEDAGPIVRVATGQLVERKKGFSFKEADKKKPWGYMHQGCFLLAVGDPAAIHHLG